MNERIKELAEWAGYNGHYATEEFDVDEFARLIVHDCLSAISKTQVAEEEMIKCYDQVVTHFGVEE